MSRAILVLILCSSLCALLSTGCSRKKDSQVESTLKELDTFTEELLRKVESSSNPSIGIDEAQKYFSARQPEMTTKLSALKEVTGAQVTDLDETKRKMTESLTNNLFSVTGLRTRYVSQSMGDPAFKAKLDKLVSDYQALLQL